MNKTMIISNADIGDEVFESRSHGHWNVTRALRDCLAGKHRQFVFNVAEVANAARDTEFDQAKVDAMVADPARLKKAPGLIFVIRDQMLWLIDGIHRIHALHQLGEQQSVGFVIEEADSAPYRVRYNGEQYPPWVSK